MPIVLRVIFRSERRDIFTGLYCEPAHWDGDNKRLMKTSAQAAATNRNLDLICRKANDAFDEMKYSGVGFTIDELVDRIRGREARPTLLIEFLEAGNEKMLKRVGTEILKVTYMKYKRSVSYMEDYLQQEYRVKNFSLQKVDYGFLEGYFRYLRNSKKICHNTACKYLVCLKTIFAPAIRTGVLKSDPFFGLKITPKYASKDVLTKSDLAKLTDLELDDPDLERKRDIFLFACYTGLAYIDLQQLNANHLIDDGDGCWYIRKPRQKTGEDSIIPMLPAALRILEKYSPTGKVSDFRWFVSTNQKMNKGLKYIAKRAGITKDLHMHLARHTFATTVTLSNGVPIETVSKMLGHASIKQTQHYARVVPLKIKNDMERLMGIYR